MKNVILVTNEIYPYRVPVYNYFSCKLLEEKYNLFIYSNKIINYEKCKIEFNLIVENFNFIKYKNLINNKKPSCVIVFLHLKNIILWPLIFWLKLRKIPVIYWGHGINLQNPKSIYKKFLFKFIHTISDAILLYSKNELKFISENNRYKVFTANNTLNFNSFKVISTTKEKLKRKHGINFKKVVLFVGRINPRKKVEDIINIFLNLDKKDYGLIIIGPCLEDKYRTIIKNTNNIIYLGPIYNQDLLNEYFKLSDVFSIPGTNGLGIVHAFYWGLPVVTEDVRHSPEITYLKQGKNGFIVKENNIHELKQKILLLLENGKIYKEFSNNARKTIAHEATIEKMFEGFINSIKFVDSKSDN